MLDMRKGVFLALLIAASAVAQTQPGDVTRYLSTPILPPDVAESELRTYLMRKVQVPPWPARAENWTAEARQLKERILKQIVFHGWPREWVDGPLKFEDLGVIEANPEYRMRRLRYEIVPGMQSTAILYEPANMQGKVPAILNVNGHVGPLGKSIEYKQKRCINQARRGILALNLEWLSFGELAHSENVHWFAAHLDLVGSNSLGLFYLAMRRGLDYLYQHPSVDRSRIGMTGLSGGGWQTIVLSALDERVFAAVPVAGYSSLASRIERPADVGDVEQNATDLLTIADYPLLTAIRAPRPTLLVYNVEDDCCFRAPLVKPYIFDFVRPYFKLYGDADRLSWHENTDPSTHNYQLDNRQQSYRFFARHFGMPAAEREIPVDAEIKSYDELAVGLPKDNLTILGVAKVLAARIERRGGPSGNASRSAWAQSQRDLLRQTVRYRPVDLRHAWAVGNSHRRGLETRSYRFEFDNGLSASAVWLQALSASQEGPATIMLNDDGRKAAGGEVSDRVNRGERVLALDPLFIGDAQPRATGLRTFGQLLAATGDRALGIEAAQVASTGRWIRKSGGAKMLRIETSGIRSQVIALVAAVLEPDLFSEVVFRKGMKSLAHLLDAPVEFSNSADLFCLDLYRHFDIEPLTQAATKTRIVWR
ncbi:MAG TPA: hypothetical protein VFQ79_19110 [Bryobacteraceae bacterium]|nr:hypothetical protein [Bryobacteraceae bacterium]